MTQQAPLTLNVSQIAKTLLKYRFRWIIPTVVIAVAALGYACIKKADYQASQALSVREEAVGSLYRQGRFDDVDAMKTAQETVLELAKSRAVVRAAMLQLGRPQDSAHTAWPTEDDIEKVQGSLKIVAPNGSEFGSTEVFYLKIKDKSMQHAIALTEAICDQLDIRMKELRDGKAQSMVTELNKTVELAQADLDKSTTQLSALEMEVGSDLAELRLLNENSSGESNLRQTLGEVKNLFRQVKTTHRTNRQLLELLQAAQQDPGKLVAAPNQLLQSQSALRQLKDGLIAAQLNTATLLGRMSNEHPQVKAALAAQEQIRSSLHAELATAIEGIEAELKINAARLESLEKQHTEIEFRMNNLAKMRAGYENLVADVRQRNETLKKARHDLSAAKASQATAQSVNLITRLDGPIAGNRPTGPRKSLIVLAGIFGGLVTGLGLVFLTVPTTSPVVPVVEAKPQVQSQPIPHDEPSVSGLSLKQALARLTPIEPVWN